MRQSPTFREFVEQSVHRRDGSQVVVDVSECEYLDSTFLGCLIGLKKLCEKDRSRFIIAANEQDKIRLFATSVLDRYLPFTNAAPPAATELIELDTPELDPKELGRHVMHAHRLLAGLDCRDADKFRSIADRLQEELGESTVTWER
jgi:anti-anti-sigma factor